MTENITSFADIQIRWISGDSLPPEETVDQFIDDVESQFMSALPDIPDRISAGSLTPEEVKRVVSTIIIEFLQTEGTGKSSQVQSYTGISYAMDTYRPNARYSLELTEDDISKLAPASMDSNIGIIRVVTYPRKYFRPGELDY